MEQKWKVGICFKGSERQAEWYFSYESIRPLNSFVFCFVLSLIFPFILF